jgi:hypothetical protein
VGVGADGGPVAPPKAKKVLRKRRRSEDDDEGPGGHAGKGTLGAWLSFPRPPLRAAPPTRLALFPVENNGVNSEALRELKEERRVRCRAMGKGTSGYRSSPIVYSCAPSRRRHPGNAVAGSVGAKGPGRRGAHRGTEAAGGGDRRRRGSL